MYLSLLLLTLLLLSPSRIVVSQTTTMAEYLIQPGDTWSTLSWRFAMHQADLKAINGHMNLQRQPTIGTSLKLPAEGAEMSGRLIRAMDGGVLQTAAKHATSPWQIAIQNHMRSPFRPLLMRPLFVPSGSLPPKDLPSGLDSLELSNLIAQPGEAIAFRATTKQPVSITAGLENIVFDVFAQQHHVVGLAATGAFFGAGEPELIIHSPGEPLWAQPWRFVDRPWGFQQITLTGSAAAIDQQSIAQERARLFELWTPAAPDASWNGPFQLPVVNYLEISSAYGIRRSYNGGPYRTYHEGVDFAAYGGTPVYAVAAGTVILAENLYVRGNSVIIDHGLGVYTGYYHLSSLSAEVGANVQAGDLVGEVGTTGLSTGNHLHWDLLVADTWVDAESWLAQDMACWILEGIDRSCE